MTPLTGVSHLTQSFEPNGQGIVTDYYAFFTNNNIPSCDITCSVGNTCGGPLSSNYVSVETVSPLKIKQLNSISEGYSESLCIQCQSNDNIFEKNIEFIQIED